MKHGVNQKIFVILETILKIYHQNIWIRFQRENLNVYLRGYLENGRLGPREQSFQGRFRYPDVKNKLFLK